MEIYKYTCDRVKKELEKMTGYETGHFFDSIKMFRTYATKHGMPFHAADEQYNSSFCCWYYETKHKETGRKYINIPDQETIDIIESIKVDKITPDQVKQKFNCVSWVFPNKSKISNQDSIPCISMRYSPKDKHDRIIKECKQYNREEVNSDCSTEIRNAIIIKSDTAFYNFISLNDDNLHKMLLDGPSNTVTNIVSTEKAELDNGGVSAYNMALFIYKANIFIQAHPECLQEGAGFNEFVMKRVKKKFKKVKIKRPTIEFKMPLEYRRSGSAHYRMPHFRSLMHEKYARVDNDGNVLPVGDEGNIRIVPVKGSMVKGKLYHVKK